MNADIVRIPATLDPSSASSDCFLILLFLTIKRNITTRAANVTAISTPAITPVINDVSSGADLHENIKSIIKFLK